MSIIGTGVAAGVANAAQTAQQTGRRQAAHHAATTSTARDASARYVEKIAEASMEDADDQLPDPPTPGYETIPPPEEEPDHETPDDASPEALGPAAPDSLPIPTGDLYHHIDVEA